MKTPSVLLLAGTLLVAGSAALLARALLKPAPAPVVQQVAPPVEKAPRQAILVAARDIQPGEFIDTAAVHWQETDEEHSPLLYFLKSQDEVSVVLGATVRQALAKGQALTSNLVVRPGQPGFIAAVLKPGMRAISVPTSAVASNSGLVSTGDRVDVILSLDREKENTGKSTSAPRLASQTLLHNVRVLALNNVAHGELTVREDEPANGKKTRREYSSYETVTLEVSPNQAERLAVAKEVGTLQLVLLGAREPDDIEVDSDQGGVTTLAQATSIYNGLGSPAATPPAAKLQLFRGPAIEVRDLSH
ncbi:Flp pilus assembly protein CpaB [Pseudomonas sp. LRF_L74]|uniref:Flp pilus assembly protein CpaB n=1 Tax=Pseudomonas sp. LRF_L74 TaxID=3369422 RepID=UPI003F5D7E32